MLDSGGLLFLFLVFLVSLEVVAFLSVNFIGLFESPIGLVALRLCSKVKCLIVHGHIPTGRVLQLLLLIV